MKETALRNKSTILYVHFQGMLAGFCGIVHGTSEILHGNAPTGGNLLASVGAFTVIQNYLITGICTILAACAIVVWTLGFIHKKHGPATFLLLTILLFLVGGGIAQVLFFLIAWGVSTRVNKPLIWWQKVLPDPLRMRLAKNWLPVFIAGYFFLSIGVGIWLILLPPGVAHAVSALDYVCWTFLAIGLLFQIATIVCGFARDISQRIIPVRVQ